MLQQRDVLKWFKQLQGDERIELMCNLFDSCLPLEIRFLATYIEFLANNHYQFLRKWEKTANEMSLESFCDTDLLKADGRRTLCVYLALLYSHNNQASAKFFNVLMSFLDKHQCPRPNDNEDSSETMTKNDWNELRLLLAMASYHPAFKFYDQRKLLSKLSETSRIGKRSRRGSSKEISLDEDSPATVNGNTVTHLQAKELERVTSSSRQQQSTESKATELKTIIPPLSPMNLPTSFPDSMQSLNISTRDTRMTSPPPSMSPMILTQLQTSQAPGTPLQSSMQPPSIGVVYPTNIQMINNASVIMPSGTDAKSPLCNPLMPGSNGVLTQFYTCPSQVFGNQMGRPNYQLHSSSAPIPVQTSRHGFHPNMPGLQPTFNQSSGNAFSFGSSPTFASPLQSPFTSPLPSPKSSPRPSPAQSPMFPRKGGDSNLQKKYQHLSSVYEWLKSLRLHKYIEVFNEFTFEKLLALTEEDLIDLRLTQGARKKLRLNIDVLRERGFKSFGVDQPLDRKVPVQPEPNLTGDRQRNFSIPTFNNNILGQLGNGNSLSGSNLVTSPRANQGSGINLNLDSQSPALVMPFSPPPPGSMAPGPAPQMQIGKPIDDFYGNRNVIVLQSPPSNNRLLFPQTMPTHCQRPISTTMAQPFQRDGSSPLPTNPNDMKADVGATLYHLRLNNDSQTVSCFNCGASTHPGEFCNESSIDTNSQGRYGFNMKYETTLEDGKKT